MWASFRFGTLDDHVTMPTVGIFELVDACTPDAQLSASAVWPVGPFLPWLPPPQPHATATAHDKQHDRQRIEARDMGESPCSPLPQKDGATAVGGCVLRVCALWATAPQNDHTRVH